MPKFICVKDYTLCYMAENLIKITDHRFFVLKKDSGSNLKNNDINLQIGLTYIMLDLFI